MSLDAQLSRHLQQRFEAGHERADLGEVRSGHELRVQRQSGVVIARLCCLDDLVQTEQRVT